jgi:exopolysaccharide production protein ExoZ
LSRVATTIDPRRQAAAELVGVQILRGLAASAVVAHHALEQSNGSIGRFSPDWLTVAGASGVDVFFVISGFIMLYVAFPAGRQSLDAGTFLFRRAMRIYPIYWLCCLAILIISWAGLLHSHKWTALDLVASFLLLPTDNGLINVAWTLVYEMYFYAIFAATLVFGSMTITAVAVTATIVGLGFAGHWLTEGSLQSFLANPIALEFGMGIWLGFVFVNRRPTAAPKWVPLATGLIGTCFLLVSPLFIPHANTSGLTGFPRVGAWGLPAILVVASFLAPGSIRSSFGRLLVLIGDASYALYLTHVFVMIGYGWLLKTTAVQGLNQLLVVPAVVALSICLGLFVHLVVERRIQLLVRRLSGGQPGLPRPAAG